MIRRAFLLALALTSPLYAATAERPSRSDGAFVANETAADVPAVVSQSVPPSATVRDLQKRVETLETTLQSVRAQELERLQTIGDPSSHPLWP